MLVENIFTLNLLFDMQNRFTMLVENRDSYFHRSIIILIFYGVKFIILVENRVSLLYFCNLLFKLLF